ncbi:CD209 antigen-like protein E [Hoplias malabaricus]|uniref:CD209 antigen-like protein E n=1 Tax=Hoplias malabaricus TaxID=27720 RepID=UPI0034625BE2
MTNSGHDAVRSKCYRLAVVCLGLLCVLLLIGITVLWIEYSNLKKSADLSSHLQSGWVYFGSSFYFISCSSKSWSESRDFCRNRGADMVIINSEEEQDFIAENLCNAKNAWIGLTDRDTEGKWEWVDGSILISGNWKKGEPNNKGNEDCVEFFPQTKKWNDEDCSDEKRWICEKKVGALISQ